MEALIATFLEEADACARDMAGLAGQSAPTSADPSGPIEAERSTSADGKDEGEAEDEQFSEFDEKDLPEAIEKLDKPKGATDDV